MLKEIRSKIFRKKFIIFHNGLNIVLGNNNGSNSIGKSTLLMIVDFIFGGETYLVHNRDVIDNLGKHEFLFCFEWDGKEHYFIRNTENSAYVYECDNEYNIVNELDLDKYTNILKIKYNINYNYSTFRSMVSLYSRVWGKNNYDIKRPLHSFIKSNERDMINNLIKLFNKYDSIENINNNIKLYTNENKALNNAVKYKYLPNITKKTYLKNIRDIKEITNKLNTIEENMELFSNNITELRNDEILTLNKQKTILLNQKSTYSNKLQKLESNIMKNSTINKNQFDKLKEFFPNVNIDKLQEIEGFHKNICRYLEKEINREKNEIRLKLELIEEELNKINSRIAKILNIEKKPEYIIETLIDLSYKLNKLKEENNFYENKNDKKDILNKEKDKLKENIKVIFEEIEKVINSEIMLICDKLSDKPLQPPKLTLKDYKYNYEILDDTGAGNAYLFLIILDIAMFTITNLPILIHDSMLFKNVERDNMESIISIYNSSPKQVFIAIDEIYKYSDDCQKIIQDKKVIELDDENTLFNKIWNKKAE